MDGAGGEVEAISLGKKEKRRPGATK